MRLQLNVDDIDAYIHAGVSIDIHASGLPWRPSDSAWRARANVCKIRV
jgi:hypothetical protein